MRKEYSSPELEFINIALCADILNASDPESIIPSEAHGNDEDDPFGLGS